MCERLSVVMPLKRIPRAPGSAGRLAETGRSAAWLARVLWEHEVAGSNPAAPTKRAPARRLDTPGEPVRFIDPTGIRAIISAVEARPAGCVIPQGVRGGVANVFQIADLSGVPRLHIEACDQPSTAS